MIDTHCHIQFRGYEDDRNEVILRCQEKGVMMNAIGTQQDTSKKAVELAEKYDNIYATIGLHPVHLHATEVDEEESNFLSREENFDEAFYDKLAKSPKVIGVGECGLELYHLPEFGNPSANAQGKEKILEKQKEIFIKQYNFAIKHDLPLVIHVREAYEEMLLLISNLDSSRGEKSFEVENGEIQKSDVINSTNPTKDSSSSLEGLTRNEVSGVVHCYSSNWQNAQQFLDFGLYLGFTGVITFPARKTNPQPTFDLLEVVEKCPLDRILVETDAPYLAPQAYRGKKCEPWMVEEVVKKIAEIRGLSVKEMQKIVNDNALRLFTKIKI